MKKIKQKELNKISEILDKFKIIEIEDLKDAL